MTTPDHTDAHARMLALLAEGLPVREVARQTNIPYGTVRNAARRMGRSLSRGHRNADNHPWRLSRVGRKPKKEEEAP